jgi:integrase
VIYERGKFYWYQFQVNGQRISGSAGTTNKVEALRREAERRTRAAGNPAENGKHRFSDSFPEFLQWSAAHVKPTTQKRYKVSGKRLQAFLGPLKLSEMSTAHVERFKSERSGECSNAAVNRDVACLRTFRNWCLRIGYSVGQCVFTLLPEGPGNMRIVSHQEQLMYTEHAQAPLGDIATIVVETGMRPGEVYAMQGEHINLNGRYVCIPSGKTAFARRTIPLTDAAYAVLGRLWKPGRLFEGKAIEQITIRAHKKLCERLGFDFRLYEFRHTYGTRMAMAGVDLMTLRELMGHSSITITQRYCHPTSEHKKAAVAKLEEWNSSHKKATCGKHAIQ